MTAGPAAVRVGSNFGGLVRSQAARQSGLLMASQGLAVSLSFAYTVLTTRGLDVSSYGQLRYVMTFWAMGATLLQFGWQYSAARLLALQTDPGRQRQIVGACVSLVLLGGVLGVIVTATTFGIAQLREHPLPRVLLLVSPFVTLALGQAMITSICQGLNRVPLLSFQQVLPYLILLPLTAWLVLGTNYYSLPAAIASYVTAMAAVLSIGFWRLRPAFRHACASIREIARENRRTGFPMYVGGIFGVASGQVIAMWTAAYVDPAAYGRYALALACASPLSLAVASVGTAVFRSSSVTPALPRKLIIGSGVLGGGLGLLFLAATQWLFVPAFGEKYASAVSLARVLGSASIMIGWGDIFNRFLAAHGQGRRLGLAAIGNGMAGIVAAGILLPRWGVDGAVASALVASGTYLAVMLLSYVRYTRSSGSGRARAAGARDRDSGRAGAD